MASKTSASKTAFAALGLLAALASGCTTMPPPVALDLNSARVTVQAAAPAIVIDGIGGGKAGGAAAGAGTGLGVGTVAGGVACLATGPFFALCLATVLPTTMSVGAVSGAVIGGARTESTAATGAKGQLLRDELGTSAYGRLLGEQLQQRLRADFSADVALGDGAPDDAAGTPSPAGMVDRPWTIEVGLSEVGTEGKDVFALRLVATASARRAGSAEVWQLAREVQSETELTTERWTAGQSAALRAVMSTCIAQAARQLAIEMAPRSVDAAGSRRHSPRSSSCNDVPAAWMQASAPH